MQIAANLVSARTIDFMPWSQNWGIAPLGIFFLSFLLYHFRYNKRCIRIQNFPLDSLAFALAADIPYRNCKLNSDDKTSWWVFCRRSI